MPTPSIPPAISAHDAAYTWVARKLRADPFLARYVRTWRDAAEGGPGFNDPPALVQCPWVRLSPKILKARPHCTGAPGERFYEQQMQIRVETCVASINPLDSVRLANAIHRAVFAELDMLHAQEYGRISALDWEESPSASEPPEDAAELYYMDAGAFVCTVYLGGA
jgi:hypothetical protein